jgi:hypothetical protein
MNLLVNHCWCSDSIWGGYYTCRCIVTLYRVPEDKTYYDPPCPDWALLEEHPFTGKDGDLTYNDTTLRPRADVIEWLNKNVKDRKVPTYVEGGAKGWAIGADKYNSLNGIDFRFFFERQMDGMKFIKHWSVHKNPISYLQYFKNIRKELDLKTGKLARVKQN